MYEIYIYHNLNEVYFLSYKASIIPRIGEIVYFPHHGSFNVKKILHSITDDAPCGKDNVLAWIEVEVEKCSM